MTRTGILYLNHTSVIGGAETSLLGLIEHLDRERFQPHAAVPSGPLAERLAAMDIPVLTMDLERMVRTRNPLRLSRYALGVRRISGQIAAYARGHGVGLIHSNSNTAHLYGAVAARRASIPSVWHSRDLVDLGKTGRWLYAHSSGIIAISEAVRQCLCAYGKGDAAGRISVVHNGVDTERFVPRGVRDEMRQELGIGAGRVVAMVAHVVPWKRHNVFIQAASRIAEEISDVHFLIVGGDPFDEHADYRRSLDSMVTAQHLSDQLTFAGLRGDIPAVLEAVDVVVHPALAEPFGRVIVEAMAAGKPVVAVDAAGPKEIIRSGQDGILVPTGTPQELALATTALVGDEEQRERVGRAARKRVEEAFTLDACVRKTEALYERFVSA